MAKLKETKSETKELKTKNINWRVTETEYRDLLLLKERSGSANISAFLCDLTSHVSEVAGSKRFKVTDLVLEGK